jgi:excisionase family DNA binding protein
MESLLVTIPEAAELLGVSKAQIYRMLDAGEFRSIKIGKKLRRIPRLELAAWIDRQTNEGQD